MLCQLVTGDKWQRPKESGSHKYSPDSDSESCDVSSSHSKEPAEGIAYKRKGIIDKTSTLSKRGHQKCKGKFVTVYEMF